MLPGQAVSRCCVYSLLRMCGSICAGAQPLAPAMGLCSCAAPAPGDTDHWSDPPVIVLPRCAARSCFTASCVGDLVCAGSQPSAQAGGLCSCAGSVATHAAACARCGVCMLLRVRLTLSRVSRSAQSRGCLCKQVCCATVQNYAVQMHGHLRKQVCCAAAQLQDCVDLQIRAQACVLYSCADPDCHPGGVVQTRWHLRKQVSTQRCSTCASK